MIPLKRIRTKSAIKAKYRGDDKKERDKELLLAKLEFEKDNNKKIKFEEGYWKLAKAQLKKESNGKCAYCEANTDIVAHGDVEHFRPKSVYWWLAYTYDNYLYSCQICNQSYKGNEFPIGGSSQFPGPAIGANTPLAQIEQLKGWISPDPIDIDRDYTLQAFLDAQSSETAHLINPYFDNPSVYFAYEAYEYDEDKIDVKIIPKKPAFAEYVKAAEDYYGINRPELKSNRGKIYRIFRAFKLALLDLPEGPTKKEVERQIRDMKSDSYLFAGMNRYFDAIL